MVPGLMAGQHPVHLLPEEHPARTMGAEGHEVSGLSHRICQHSATTRTIHTPRAVPGCISCCAGEDELPDSPAPSSVVRVAAMTAAAAAAGACQSSGVAPDSLIQTVLAGGVRL